VDSLVFGHNKGTKARALAVFVGKEETMLEELNLFFNYMGKVTNMGGIRLRKCIKLLNQITIPTMVGLVEGMVYAHNMCLDVDMYSKAISIGASRSRYLYLYDNRILMRDFDHGLDHYVKEMRINLKKF
jgi:3-hydroxyisobutyrate dehydrogenase-like beta-hydroxyacid dehydrogenase